MSRVLMLVEGQTEQTFVERQLTTYLAARGLFLEKPIILPTKKIVGQPFFKGGITSYRQVKNTLQRLLYDSNARLITTMLDYYGLPEDFPGYQLQKGNCYDRVRQLEEAFQTDVQDHRFVSYFSLHEFEALLFVSPETIAERFVETNYLNDLKQIKEQFQSPEEINDDPKTAPSKRLKGLIPEYNKVTDGVTIIEQIGIDRLRTECRHFHEWLTKLESLGTHSS